VSAASVTPEFVAPESPLDVQLRPVIAGLVQGAEQRASQVLKEADQQAAAVLADAQRRGEAILESARAEGAAAARRSETRILADARREAREKILRAQRGVYEQVRSLAQDQLDRFGGAPAAKELNARLATVVRARLGPKATVEDSKSGIGVVATQGRRRLDLDCDTLVQRELAQMAPRIEELWS
jgi:vacuolar-type H+-ATPase subunit E/Vma4